MESITVNKTMDYSIFKQLKGNRTLRNNTIKQIINSIQDVGAIPNPIIVNENMEVIDGQHRIEALKTLKLPVYYIVVPGLTVKHCSAMNMNQANWSLRDYIKSHADIGNRNYINFQNLLKKYPKLGLTTTFAAVTGLFGLDPGRLKNGNLDCDDEKYKIASDVLEYCMEFEDVVSRMDGRRDVIYVALMFCYFDKNVNNQRLKDKFIAGYKTISPIAKIDQCLEEISELYNAHLKDGRVYLKTDYYRHLETQFKWYNKKWSAKRNYLTEYLGT